ncbi:NAD(P)/FAD-dependent oxidoreductase [Candidatus Bathyarchaeota archaeon]|nr:NAD(P)/FAD-dependent oxidoreductase [Candidatus Bathyarchaeota archaeon]
MEASPGTCLLSPSCWRGHCGYEAREHCGYEACPLEQYDVIVVGGGIAGSVAARFGAEQGLEILLLEKYRTPREKACSGIQFPYLEKLIGETIPREKLCKNELYRIEMVTPSDKIIKAKMKMLNFWRSTFDSWLNKLATDAGAEFRDGTSLIDFRSENDSLTATIMNEDRQSQVKANYLIGADGSLSTVRRKLQPQDYGMKASQATINYYFAGKAELDANTLYMFYKKEFCPSMFAWVYLKDNNWVIGTGANENVAQYAERFYNYVQKKYRLSGEIVRREGFASTLQGGAYLGEGNVLLSGDSAGLIDEYRGMGMDNAALSGRLAVKAVVEAKSSQRSAIEIYQRLMKKSINRFKTNEKRQSSRYASNKTLEQSLSRINLLRGGLKMIVANQINRLLPSDKLIFLPI